MPDDSRQDRIRRAAPLAIVALLAQAHGAAAADAPAAEPNAAPTVSFSADVELSTAYVFRGLNVFGDRQSDAHGLVAPSFLLGFPGPALTVGFWTGWQWSGDNTAHKLHAGAGGEVDLCLTWDTAFLDDSLALAATLLWYFYPAATEEDAGAAMPSYLEPTVLLTWSGAVDLSFKTLYSAGVQDALDYYRYLYFRPSVSRTVDIGAAGSMSFELGVGYKLFHGHPAADGSNVWDVQLDWRWAIPLTDAVYLQPAFHVAWTNLGGVAFADELVYWAGANLGFGL
ncbi:MAG: hypothetical protein HY905_19950 [Deltaproteobacteria bacterium]|nr:hypothetical protein [Deltaproteobacteria bacterium]